MFGMKKVTSVCLIILLLTSVGSVQARGKAEGTVKEITGAGSHSSIELSNTIVPVNGTESVPACATDLRRMELSSSQKNQLAILLTAQAQGIAVSMVGAGVCTIIGTREDISFVVMKP